MLKIALIRWKAKCSRHPRFNPDTDGAAAIRGNCSRCLQLQAIYENHSRTLKLIRAFGPPPSLKRGKGNLPPSETRRPQLMLFSERLSNERSERDESATEIEE